MTRKKLILLCIVAAISRLGVPNPHHLWPTWVTGSFLDVFLPEPSQNYALRHIRDDRAVALFGLSTCIWSFCSSITDFQNHPIRGVSASNAQPTTGIAAVYAHRTILVQCPI
ncbi:hypothetical protein GALMADRAFT_238563 [Galerina marginata CBS 339.88]|uniref:Secreted protein n=1 Tax=Galerina marginata (strain CBS 339.88) TaxID=685588 RepID=A0A067TIE3_GALM3|nr:hypothetical protein GALMADRAFT_238563 [Galerina marginata CBS 339.88]